MSRTCYCGGGGVVIKGAEQNLGNLATDTFPGPAPTTKPRNCNNGRTTSIDEDAPGEFAVRTPTAVDARSLASLWAEMQRHYGQPVADASAAAAAAFACEAGHASGFDPRVLVSVADTGAVVGALVMNVTFPAVELTRSLYIRDLYVAMVARRRGVARSLLRTAAALTLSEGFSALEWTADARNTDACRFYESAGAVRLDRVYFRLSGSDLRWAAGS